MPALGAQVLANFTDINAFLSADDVCQAVREALSTPLAARQRMGAAARRAFERDHAEFVQRARAFAGMMQQQQLLLRDSAAGHDP